MNLDMLFWAAIIAKVLSIAAVTYFAWIGQRKFQTPAKENKEQTWKSRGVEKQDESGSLVPSAAHQAFLRSC